MKKYFLYFIFFPTLLFIDVLRLRFYHWESSHYSEIMFMLTRQVSFESFLLPYSFWSQFTYVIQAKIKRPWTWNKFFSLSFVNSVGKMIFFSLPYRTVLPGTISRTHTQNQNSVKQEFWLHFQPLTV